MERARSHLVSVSGRIWAHLTRVADGILRPGSCGYHLPPVMTWTALFCAFFGTILLGQENLPFGDLSGQFHAFALFQSREMAQGRLPLWSPGSYAGIPFAADPQSGTFYVPRWITIVATLHSGLTYYALELEVLTHAWLAGVFCYALGYSLTRRRLAGLVAAIAFGLGGYLTSYPLLQLAILETICWLPLALLLIRRATERTNPVPCVVGAGLVLALSGTAGHPQTWMHVCYVAAAYYCYLAMRARWRWTRVVTMGLLCAAVAIGGSACTWLPAWRYLVRTARGDVSYAFVAGGLPMLDYVQCVVAGAVSLWSPQFVGTAALLLAALALVGSAKGDEARFWGLLAGVTAWLALGDAGVLFQAAYRLLPGFSLFRQQERLLGLVTCSAAMLAALGVARWQRLAAPDRRALVRRLLTASVCVVGLAGLVLSFAARGSTENWVPVLARTAVVGVLVLALLWRSSWRRLRSLALVLLMGTELYFGTYGGIARQPSAPMPTWPAAAWLGNLVAEANVSAGSAVRLDSRDAFTANLGEIYGVEDVSGISPLKPAALEALERLPLELRWQLLNVGYVVVWAPPAGASLTHVAEIPREGNSHWPHGAVLYRFGKALPRAWMSYRPIVVGDSQEALRVLGASHFDPARDVVLQGPIPGPVSSAASEGTSHASVQVQRTSATELEINVRSERDGALVISEWHYPGWRAKLDGHPTPLYTANYAFQAVLVPGGEHRVSIRFVPVDVYVGLALSLAALLAGALCAWLWHPSAQVCAHAALAERRSRRTFQAVSRAAAVLEPVCTRAAKWLARASGWGVLAIVLLGVAARLYRLGYQELRGDEAFGYLVARQPLGEIVPMLLRMGEANPPLHFLTLHAAMRWWGASEMAMRLSSLVPGVLFLPVAYLLGRQIGGRRLGLLLALLGAASSGLVWVSQDARNQYTLAILFGALATLLLGRAVERSRWWLWVLYAACCALSVYSHYYGAFALAAHGIAMVAIPGWRRRFWPWLASCLAAGALFLPWFWASWSHVWATGQFQTTGQPNLAEYLTDFGRMLAVGLTLDSSWARWLFLGALALAVIGARELLRYKPGWGLLCIAWLGGAALVIYLLRFTREMYNTFYITVAAPAWWILVGVGIQSLCRRPRGGVVWAGASIVLLLIANGASLWHNYADPAYSRSSGYRALAAALAPQVQAGDVFVANYPDPCFDYYLGSIPMARTMQPGSQSATPQETANALLQLGERYDRLWFSPAHGSAWDPDDVAFRWLEEHLLLEGESKYDHLALLAYRPPRTARVLLTPLGTASGGLVRLHGAALAVDGVPAATDAALTLMPGAQLRVTLVWQATARIPEGYTAFVHLIGEDGRLIAQHDGWPARGQRPTWTWQVGDWVLDRHEIVIPERVAPRSAVLVAGMYNSQTIRRLTFADGSDVIRLGDVRFVGRE